MLSLHNSNSSPQAETNHIVEFSTIEADMNLPISITYCLTDDACFGFLNSKVLQIEVE